MIIPEIEQNHQRCMTELILHSFDFSCNLIFVQPAVFRNTTKTNMQFAECLCWSCMPIAGLLTFCGIRILFVI
jgi:hypothetical protein